MQCYTETLKKCVSYKQILQSISLWVWGQLSRRSNLSPVMIIIISKLWRYWSNQTDTDIWRGFSFLVGLRAESIAAADLEIAAANPAIYFIRPERPKYSVRFLSVWMALELPLLCQRVPEGVLPVRCFVRERACELAGPWVVSERTISKLIRSLSQSFKFISIINYNEIMQ